MSEVVGIGSIIILDKSKLWKAKFFKLWCNISGEAVGETWRCSLLGVERIRCELSLRYGDSETASDPWTENQLISSSGKAQQEFNCLEAVPTFETWGFSSPPAGLNTGKFIPVTLFVRWQQLEQCRGFWDCWKSRAMDRWCRFWRKRGKIKTEKRCRFHWIYYCSCIATLLSIAQRQAYSSVDQLRKIKLVNFSIENCKLKNVTRVTFT